MDGRWVEVGDGVFARRYRELDLTVGLVLGAEQALVVDTRGDERQGAELAAAVRKVTALPLQVAITHAHFDHCFGTAAFAPAAVHALPRCREVIAATAQAQRTQWSARYREQGDNATATALAATDPPLPAATAPISLDLGGRRADLLHLGRGHTDHDMVVHVPDAGVVFAGDLVEQGAPPDLGDAVVAEWPHTLDALLELAPVVVVPGHGAPVDPGFVAAQRAELDQVALLYAAVARGELDPAEAQRRSPYPDVPWRVARPPRPRAPRVDPVTFSTTFSTELRELAGSTWDAAVRHQFVDEIWRGAVPPGVLATYLAQDHQFFDAFVALMGAAVASADTAPPRVVHARQLGVVAGPENDFFARALDALDVPLGDRTHPLLLAPTEGFIALMDDARRSADYASCLAVLLVAEWVYLDWATRADADLPDEPIQREWIQLHSGPAFEAWVAFLRGEFDRVTAKLDDGHRERVRELFTRAVELELAFFEAAYG